MEDIGMSEYEVLLRETVARRRVEIVETLKELARSKTVDDSVIIDAAAVFRKWQRSVQAEVDEIFEARG